jgi:hypothetical protein
MYDYRLEVFEESSTSAELRLHGGDGVTTRRLATSAIDTLVDQVEKIYSRHALAPLHRDHPSLLTLGRDLYAFIDGDERWLSKPLADPPGAVLRIDGEERLRHLPWELLAHESSHLAVSPTVQFLPARSVPAESRSTDLVVENRPLRVLFMAASPEGVEPMLAFEMEEAMILDATTETPAELVVEESGTLDGLRALVESYGAGHFDVLHLSGHATVGVGGPRFLLEDEFGGPAPASPGEIINAMRGLWPRLVFVSGCLTGNAPDQGQLPSMSESIVTAGAPTVLGWALPVGDLAASQFASLLYRCLAAGRRLDEAVAEARHVMYAEHESSFWHYLRLYTTRNSPLMPMVTPLKTKGRSWLRVRPAANQFLDPDTQLSKVAGRGEFVGRRRLIQRCLRALADPSGAECLLLQGMGGLGKSTVASRLIERMPDHQRAVWYKGVDEVKLRDLTSKVQLDGLPAVKQANEILSDSGVDLDTRLRYLLAGPLADVPCLFVFDDFEDGNLDARPAGRYVCKPDSGAILGALLRAIRATNSASRAILTSRYEFPEPTGTRMLVESLETLRDNELAKKVNQLQHLRPTASTDEGIRERAIEAAAGNPRLLEWLDKVVSDTQLDVEGLIAAIENEADRFRRENIFAQKLLDSQPEVVRTMLARVNVVELPVPLETVLAIHQHPDAEQHVDRASQLGLLEAGTDPTTQKRRYFVSNVLRPLIRPLLSPAEYRDACAAAARSLYEVWAKTGDNNASESKERR